MGVLGFSSGEHCLFWKPSDMQLENAKHGNMKAKGKKTPVKK